MRSVILSLLVVQLLLSGAYSDGEERIKKPMCVNPRAKVGASILSGCSQATCKKEGKGKAVWQECKQLEDLERKIDKNQVDLEGKVYKTQVDLEGKIDKSQEDLEAKIDKNQKDLERKIDKNQKDLEGKLDKNQEDLEGKIDKNQEDLTGKIDKNQEDLERKIDQNQEDLERKIDKNQEDLERKIDQNNEDLERKIYKMFEIFGCPSGWSPYKSSCYRFYSPKITWTQAQAECQKENSNLASVPNAEIQTFIGGLQKNNHAWIGGSRPAGSNPKVGWEWLNNSPWSYENWAGGEPSNWNEQCLIQYGSNFYWNDGVCSSYTYSYLCEKHSSAA